MTTRLITTPPGPPPATAGPIRALHEAGTSVWLDDLSRGLIEDGVLGRLVADGVTGVTCNPTIFARALSGSDRYDAQLASSLRGPAADPRELYLTLALRDVEQAADLLAESYTASDGRDGYVSFECTPDVAGDPAATIDQALEVRRRVPAPNLMVKVPGNDAGVVAIEELTAAGVNVNVTLLFSARRYEEASCAYLRGLARRAAAGQDVHRVRSVASIFVSRVDGHVDAALPAGHPLRGRVGIANARAIHARWSRLRGEPRWVELQAQGAAPQRPLWASTAPKDPAYPDLMYLEALALKDTILTVPGPTLNSYGDRGSGHLADGDITDARRTLTEARGAGVDLERVGEELLAAGLERFDEDYRRALLEIEAKLARTPVA